MKKDKIKDRIAGAMYGVAVGDALGGPLEFMTQKEIYEKHGWVNGMIGGGWLDLVPGETTDDTAMTLAVAEGIMSQGENYTDMRAVVSAVGQNFLDWYHSNPKDIGATCAAVISSVDALGRNLPEDWLNASIMYDKQTKGRSGGNGALMRAVPAAIIYTPEQQGGCDGVAKWKTLATMTHWDPEAALLVADYSRVISKCVRGLDAFDDYFELMEKYRQPTIQPTGYSFDSLNMALYAYGTPTDDFKTAVEKAVNMGGDADTIGAITGGLAGSCQGYDDIPPEWIAALDGHLATRIDRFVDWAVERIMEEE